jgi:ketosteroid isomerase-like protein
MMTNVEVVKECYAKFGEGDIPGLLARFDPQIEFRLAQGHPYRMDGKPWIGGQEIARNFFMKAGPEWENWRILPEHILEAGDAVIVECRYAGMYKPTGGVLDVQVCHIWRLKQGKVTSFHQYIDTAQLQKTMGFPDHAHDEIEVGRP